MATDDLANCVYERTIWQVCLKAGAKASQSAESQQNTFKGIDKP